MTHEASIKSLKGKLGLKPRTEKDRWRVFMAKMFQMTLESCMNICVPIVGLLSLLTEFMERWRLPFALVWPVVIFTEVTTGQY